jgi:hypothetical protein
VRVSCSFTEVLLTGNMCWCGNCGSFTELLFTGNMYSCGTGGLITELLFTVNMRFYGINAYSTELLVSQESYFVVGEVVHLRNYYYLSKYILVWE